MTIRSMALFWGFFLVVGLPFTAMAGPTPPTGNDSDSDGIEDEFDNCSTASNVSQADADHNGCGDACNFGTILCDATGDGKVGAPDFQILISEFGDDCVFNPSLLCLADCTGDSKVGAPDFQALVVEFGNSQGPSGITNAQCDPATCGCTPAP